jgi:hypothetical protein
MKHVIALLALSFTTTAFAQTILRTAQIQPLLGSGVTYTVEVKIEKNQKAGAMTVINRLETTEDNEMRGFEPEHKCISELTVNSGLLMTYTVKNTRGIVIGYKQISPELKAEREVEVDNVKANCPELFKKGEVVKLRHLSDIPSFKILGSGQNLILSVGVNFAAQVELYGSGSSVTIDESTLNSVNWYSEKKDGERNRGSRELIDPANPPAPEEPLDYDRL